MTVLKRCVWIGAVVIAVALVTLVSVHALRAHGLRKQAAACLSVFQQLRVGISAENDARNELAQFRQYETRGMNSRTESDYSSYAYWFDSNSFHIPWAYDSQRFACTVMFHNGIVVEKSVGFMQRNEFTNQTIWVGSRETVRGLRQDFALDHSANGVVITRSSKVSIDIDTRVSDFIRKSVFDYDLRCLTTLAPCNDAEAILPGIKAIESLQ